MMSCAMNEKTEEPKIIVTTSFKNAEDKLCAMKKLNKVLENYFYVFDITAKKQIKVKKVKLRFKKNIPIVPYKCTSSKPIPYALREAAKREIKEHVKYDNETKSLKQFLASIEKLSWTALILFVILVTSAFLSLLHVLSSHLVRLGKAVLVALDSWLGIVLDAALLVHHLALVSAVVHHLKKSLDLEALLHDASVC